MPDPKYNDLVVERLINRVMLDGKKSTASKIVYGAFDLIENKMKEEALKVFHKAMDNIKPEWRSRPGGLAAPHTRFLLR